MVSLRTVSMILILLRVDPFLGNVHRMLEQNCVAWFEGSKMSPGALLTKFCVQGDTSSRQVIARQPRGLKNLEYGLIRTRKSMSRHDL